MSGVASSLRRRLTTRRVAVLGVVALAAVVRLYDLGRRSLWLDEVYTVVVWPKKDLLGLFFGPEPHPPLYFLFSKLWTSLVGTSTLSARILPAVFGVALVVAVVHAGRVYGDHWTGVTAGLLVAVAPTFVHFSQTARMYSLWGLLTVVSMACFTVFLYRERTPLLLYLLATVGMLYTHAFGVLVLALQNGYVLAVTLRSEWPDRMQWRPWLRLQVIVGLLSLPVVGKYAGVLVETLSGGVQSSIQWLGPPTLAELFGTVLSFGGRPIYYPVVTAGTETYWTSLVVLVLMGALGSYGLYRGQSRRAEDGATGRQWWDRPSLVLVVWALGLTVVPFLVSRVVPVFTPRNVHVAAAPLFILASLGVRAFGSSTFDTDVSPLQLVTVLVLVGGLCFSLAVYYDTPGGEDWRGAAAFVDDNSEPGDTVVSVPPWAHRPFVFYSETTSEAVVRQQSGTDSVPEGDRIWVVSRYPGQGAQLRATLDDGMQRRYDREFGSVRVTLHVTARQNATRVPAPAADSPRGP